jgi:hypothetical protein
MIWLPLWPGVTQLCVAQQEMLPLEAQPHVVQLCLVAPPSLVASTPEPHRLQSVTY